MQKEEFLKKLGSHIAGLRTGKGISQADLARYCGKDPQSLNRLERGRINPTVFYLKELAEHLGVEVDELLKFKWRNEM